MILTGILAALTASILVLAGFFIAFLLIRRRISTLVRDFLTAPNDKTPSPLAQLADTAFFMLSQRLVLQLKTTFMGLNSVDAKKEKAEAAAAILGESPVLGILAQFIPGAGKFLSKNPAAAGIISRALAGPGHKRDNGQHESGSSSIESPFAL
jgi:hypothetical protein